MPKDKDIGCAMGLAGLIVLVGIPISCNVHYGTGSFGPTQSVVATIQSKHVDAAKDSSHYMVTTDHGTFEVANGWWLGVTNADELYGRLNPGEKYLITTKGNRAVGYFMQDYPYVISVETAP